MWVEPLRGERAEEENRHMCKLVFGKFLECKHTFIQSKKRGILLALKQYYKKEEC